MILAPSISAHIVNNFVHQYKAGAIFRDEGFDRIPFRFNELLVMAGYDREGSFAAKLKGDLTPGGLAEGCTIAAASPSKRIEFGSNEDSDGAFVRD